MPRDGALLRHDRPARAASRRASVLIAVVIAVVIVAVAVAAVVSGTGAAIQTGSAAALGAKATMAADAAAHMAVRELMENADNDGDGTIGSISNDSNTATDPLISGTRVWAAQTTSAGVTTVTARAANSAAEAAVQVQLAGTGDVGAGTIMLVVINSASLTADELARRTLLESWGHTVVPISESAAQATFDAAARTASAAYVCETVTSGTVSTKLKDFTIGVVNEEASLADDLGFASSMTALSTAQVNITSGTHYITSTLGTGIKNLFSAAQPLRYLSGTQGGYTTLGTQVSSSNVTFAVMERGASLTPWGSAAGRRVYLPFGNTGTNLAQLASDGSTIMQRSVAWTLLPVARWKFDDGAGATAVDSIAGRNGTLTNGPTWTTSGRVDGGLRFDGVNDYVTIPNSSAFQVTDALSICGWIRQTAAWPTGSTTAIILRKGEDNPNNWELGISGGKIELVLDQWDGSGIRGNTTLALNTWHHVAATWDGATVRIYLNGVLDNTPTARAAPIGTDSRPVYIGGRVGATDFATGTIDDVRFYNRALTAAEVAALAAGGKPAVTSWTAVQP